MHRLNQIEGKWKIIAYPLLSSGFLCLEVVNCALAADLKSLELLLLERPIVGDAGIFFNFGPFVDPQFLGLFGFLLLVLLHLAYDLVFLPQRHPLALALCSPNSFSQSNIKIRNL